MKILMLLMFLVFADFGVDVIPVNTVNSPHIFYCSIEGEGCAKIAEGIFTCDTPFNLFGSDCNFQMAFGGERIVVLPGESIQVGSVSIPTPADATEGYGIGLACVSDINNDGSPDLVVGDPGAGTLHIYFLNSGGVVSTVTTSVGSMYGFNVFAVADYNNDGVGDLVLADNAGNYKLVSLTPAGVLSATTVLDCPAVTSSNEGNQRIIDVEWTGGGYSIDLQFIIEFEGC